MDLAAAVLTYYFTYAGRLSAEKRFHLANRMAAWNGDERAKKLLKECRAGFVPEPVNDSTLLASFEQANQVAAGAAQHIVAYELRKPFFDRYQALLGVEAELFRLRHLRQLYGIDAREVFLRRYTVDELRELESALLADDAAMRALSTWAINFMYLFHREVLREENGIDVAGLYALGEGYDTADAEQLRLCLYFYTHCIIADSNFYARNLPTASKPIYRHMLQRLETLLAGQLEQTSLDTKLEFLVCCRLAGYTSPLAKDIHKECAHSVSPEGTFLVDTHNIFKDTLLKKSFEASEHRNVLFAMSVLPRG
jgi:hypothetical protein